LRRDKLVGDADPLDYVGGSLPGTEMANVVTGADADRTGVSLNESAYLAGPGKEKKKKRRKDKGKNDNDEITDMVFGGGDNATEHGAGGDSPGKGKVRMDKKKKKRRDKNKGR
jgi:hypothetical protein